MKNRSYPEQSDNSIIHQLEFSSIQKNIHNGNELLKSTQSAGKDPDKNLAEILFITSYPPRECGIATYSQDLIKALNNKFSNSLSVKVCALESGAANYNYPVEVKYILKTSLAEEYEKLARKINYDNCIKIVLIQHEFGFFRVQEQSFLNFLSDLTKPVVIVFHTVLPHPDEHLKSNIKSIASLCESIVVMTNNSFRLLHDEYGVPQGQISVIAHGTHLVPHLGKRFLKKKKINRGYILILILHFT